jgi:hypothetical protein
LNDVSFVILHILNIRWDLIKEHSTIGLITIGEVLLFILMLELLEFEIGDGAGCEVQVQAGFVRLVAEVPHVDTVGLGNENYTWSRWGERSTGVVGAEGVRRSEDWVLEVTRDFPDGKVEVVDCDQEIIVEWRPFKGKHWSVVSL